MSGEQVQDIVDSLESQLDCMTVYRFYDDLYAYPEMRGLSCALKSDEAVYICGYVSQAATERGLDSVVGLGGLDSVVVVGPTWVVVGPSLVVTNLTFPPGKHETLSQQDALSKAATATPSSDEEQNRDFCVSWASNIILERLAGSASRDYGREDTENLFPGLMDEIDQVIGASESVPHSKVEGQNFIALQSELSSRISGVKERCAALSPR